jgi:hypothetical protein
VQTTRDAGKSLCFESAMNDQRTVFWKGVDDAWDMVMVKESMVGGNMGGQSGPVMVMGAAARAVGREMAGNSSWRDASRRWRRTWGTKKK